MFLERLAVLRFRNYSELLIDFEKSVNVFVGDNGQGKTNLLEAISVLTSGASFRHTEARLLVQSESTGPALIKGAIRRQKVKDLIKIEVAEGKRSIEINGKRSGRSTLLKHFSSVMFSPESLAIVKAGPSERRNFIDDIVFSLRPGRYTLFRDYLRTLKTRNLVLKNRDSMGILESLNPTFLFLATEVVMERLNVIKTLLPDAVKAFQNILENQSVDIAVDYVISAQSAIDWEPNTVYDAHQLRLRDLARAEIESGQTLIGPHKHDVRFIYQGQDARTFCSQGQQRAIILAFKIAQIMLYQRSYGEAPFLLLDDVLSELDERRRHNLLTVLSGLKSQIFMTSTELEVAEEFEKSELSIFRITNGKLKEQG